jgi:hypothetical protein
MIHHAESRIPLMLTAVMGPGHDPGAHSPASRTAAHAAATGAKGRDCPNTQHEVLVEEG